MRPHARRWPPARARTPRGQHGLAGAAIVLGHGGAFLGVQLGGRALDNTRRQSLGLGLPFSKNTGLIQGPLQLGWSKLVLLQASNDVIQRSNE